MYLILLLLLLPFLLWAFWMRPIKLVESQVRTAALLHRRALVRKRERTRRRDDYGNVIESDWLKEVDYFLDKVVAPDIGKAIIWALDERREDLRRRVIEPIVDGALVESGSQIAIDPDSLSPIEYEAHCAKVLRLAGWEAQTTRATGDQGADVIAEKDSVRIVLQCKKYGQPVGNKAVQEVYAAKSFERAQHAAVVSNAGYTKAAKQLAATNDVLLLHHLDLPELDRLLVG